MRSVTDGEGVNTALYDSYQLSQQIIKHGIDDLDNAIAAYEAEMQPRSQARLTKSIVGLQRMCSKRETKSFADALVSEGGKFAPDKQAEKMISEVSA
jgi:2-polyprenyl-6-methoxyphenol hydroxylase-like FAD-dependent oxidoreductase